MTRWLCAICTVWMGVLMADLPHEAERVLQFWLGPEAPRGGLPADQVRLKRYTTLWFGKNERYDAAIRDQFETLLEQAAAGELDHWDQSPRGRLALIILLDQMSRNMYRDTPRAFAYDPKALRLAEEGVARTDDQQLHPIERMFFYMPLQHSEDPARQQRSLQLFDQLAQEAPRPQRSFFKASMVYARQHADVIQEYGRFPHRNAILDRESTAEEELYLSKPGAGF